jgi:hypothetical protein
MKYVFPLPAISNNTLIRLREIFQATTRTHQFEYENKIKITNHFIDNEDDFKFIIDNIIIPTGISIEEVQDTWGENDINYINNRGINFNVCKVGDFIGPHKDKNPTKLNIMISEKLSTSINFAGESKEESYNWETPALVDVSKVHYVDPLPEGSLPRVTLQIFLTNSFDYYKKIVNTTPNW